MTMHQFAHAHGAGGTNQRTATQDAFLASPEKETSAFQALLDKHIQNLDAIRDNATAQIQRVSNQRGITDEAKRGTIARTYRQAQAQLNEMQDTGHKAMESYRKGLIDKAFSAGKTADPATAMAMRQAQQMARAVNDVVIAKEMLEGAQQDGDTILAKALAGVAFERGWDDVLNQWNHDGSNDRAMQHLIEYRQLPDVNPIIFNAHHHMTPPSELDGMRDWEITAAARDEGEVA